MLDNKLKAFLGGTSNFTLENPDYRPNVISYLDSLGISYFNPIITDRPWTPDDKDNEQNEKKLCGLHIYVVNNAMIGSYSIAEIVDSVYRGYATVVLFDKEGMSEHQISSFNAIEDLLMEIRERQVKVYILEELFDLPLALEVLIG